VKYNDNTLHSNSITVSISCGLSNQLKLLYLNFWVTVCNGLPYATRSSSVCLSCPVCDVGVLWPNGSMDQDETWHARRPRPWPHCVRWGPSSPPPKGHSPLQFLAHICCGQMAGWTKMLHGREVGLSPNDIVLDRDPAPPPQKRQSPQFLAHLYCGKMAEWIKMAHGIEVGLGPGHVVRDGNPPPAPKEGTAPNFRLISTVAKLLDASRYHLVWR